MNLQELRDQIPAEQVITLRLLEELSKRTDGDGNNFHMSTSTFAHILLPTITELEKRIVELERRIDTPANKSDLRDLLDDYFAPRGPKRNGKRTLSKEDRPLADLLLRIIDALPE